jgi:hypothetical protein
MVMGVRFHGGESEPLRFVCCNWSYQIGDISLHQARLQSASEGPLKSIEAHNERTASGALTNVPVIKFCCGQLPNNRQFNSVFSYEMPAGRGFQPFESQNPDHCD